MEGGFGILIEIPKILPEVFLKNMQILLGDEYDLFIQSYSSPTLRGLRYNGFKVAGFQPTHPTSQKLLKEFHKNFMAKDFKLHENTIRVPWCSYGFIYPSDLKPSKSILYNAGAYYIQEPSAMCPVEVLGVSSGHRVLDLCAAPGGKAVQIADHMGDSGLLVANDASPSRSRALVNNIERAGVNAVVTTEQPYKLAERFPEFFDRILVDAPCSGEGMFRRDPNSVKAYNSNKPEVCASLQRQILHHAAKMLKPGGRMVYSTCTFNPLENEGAIATFLSEHEDFTLLSIDHKQLGIQQGRPEWLKKWQDCDNGINFDNIPNEIYEELKKTGRIWPHLSHGEGHFVALLTKKMKNGASNEISQIRDDEKENCNDSCFSCPKGIKSTKKIPKEFLEFCMSNICILYPQCKIVTHGVNLYLQPEPINLDGLRVARSGLFLGECSKGHFIPSQAFAMYLPPVAFEHVANLSVDDTYRYLRGESIPIPEDFSEADKPDKPWVLVCCSEYPNLPLGWARLVQGRLKNKLSVGWVIKS